MNWCARKESNPEPPEPKSGALSVELRTHIVIIIIIYEKYH